LATQEIIDMMIEWFCRCKQYLLVTPLKGENTYTCAKCGALYQFIIKEVGHDTTEGRQDNQNDDKG